MHERTHTKFVHIYSSILNIFPQKNKNMIFFPYDPSYIQKRNEILLASIENELSKALKNAHNYYFETSIKERKEVLEKIVNSNKLLNT